MHIAILGTGAVGRGLGTALVAAGHSVTLGSRTSDNPVGQEWAGDTSGRSTDTFGAAAAESQLIINATGGVVSLEALATCDDADLDGKLLIDVANPLDFSDGFPPHLSVVNTDSLAEQIQQAHPGARVVKVLNTMSVEVMVDPAAIPGDHLAPMCGDDVEAKAEASALLADLGWRETQLLDLGGLEAARGMEMWLPLWLRLYGHVGHPMFNLVLSAPNPRPRG
ncbi:NAD(P)-binding domain-containing protein [soil metagenome]